MKYTALALVAGLGLAACQTTTDGNELNNGPSENTSVRILEDFISRPRTSYRAYQTIPDPTGTAPTSRIERFELRGGDCLSDDCRVNTGGVLPNTKARVERVQIIDWADGDTGVYEYEMYLPSSEFNNVFGISTVFGQLFVQTRDNNNIDGSDIFSLDKTDRSNAVFVVLKNAVQNQKRTRLGNIGTSSFPYDKWIKVRVEFRLSTGPDGFLNAYVDGRPIARLNAVTNPGGVLEMRYGIYQGIPTSVASQYGGKENIPPQVVYFSNVRLVRAELQ